MSERGDILRRRTDGYAQAYIMGWFLPDIEAGRITTLQETTQSINAFNCRFPNSQFTTSQLWYNIFYFIENKTDLDPKSLDTAETLVFRLAYPYI